MKVSVLILTYNHERWIAQALEGALGQEADFQYEIVVGEDCSTDRTRSIVMEYAKRHPDRIRPLLPERNQGAEANHKATLKACRGEYIANLDGDDYWTSPHKLRRQVEFLDAHPDFFLCFHPVRMHFEGKAGEQDRIFPENVRSVPTLEELLVYNFIPSCSVMLRNRIPEMLPECFSGLKMGDWPLYVMHAQRGRMKMLEDVMGVYRVHPKGVWSSLDRIGALEGNIEAYQAFGEYLGPDYRRVIGDRLAECHFQLAALLEDREELQPARRHWKLGARRLGASGIMSRRDYLNMFIRLYLLAPYRYLWKEMLGGPKD